MIKENSDEQHATSPHARSTRWPHDPNEHAALAPATSLSLPQRVEEIMRAQGMDQKAALKLAARELGIKKREAYQRMLREKD